VIRETRVVLAIFVLLALGACAKADHPLDDTTGAMAAPDPALSLADVAGTWLVRSFPDSGADTTVTNARLIATADSTGWVIELPSKQKVPHSVAVSGDSIMLKSEPYASMRRKGKTVWTESVFHLENGKLIGTTVAHYAKSGPDSVLRLHTEATKQ